MNPIARWLSLVLFAHAASFEETPFQTGDGIPFVLPSIDMSGKTVVVGVHPDPSAGEACL